MDRRPRQPTGPCGHEHGGDHAHQARLSALDARRSCARCSQPGQSASCCGPNTRRRIRLQLRDRPHRYAHTVARKYLDCHLPHPPRLVLQSPQDRRSGRVVPGPQQGPCGPRRASIRAPAPIGVQHPPRGWATQGHDQLGSASRRSSRSTHPATQRVSAYSRRPASWGSDAVADRQASNSPPHAGQRPLRASPRGNARSAYLAARPKARPSFRSSHAAGECEVCGEGS